MKKFSFVLVCTILLGTACSQKKLSQRDKNLQDQQQSTDVKKSELTSLAGTYWGTFSTTNTAIDQKIKIFLEIKDVPVSKDDGSAPVLTPKLVGFLRFILGDEQAGEYRDCAISSADYVYSSKSLSIVITDEEFKELFITGNANNTDISGSWTAPTLGTSGTLFVSKNNMPKTEDKNEEI